MAIRFRLGGLLMPAVFSCAACGGISSANKEASSTTVGCEPGMALPGGEYDLAKSRFAFGSTPMKSADASFVRWVGAHGVVAVNANGAELGLMNAGAPEVNVPDLSDDTAELQRRVADYFGNMGVQACQISNADVTSGSVGTVIVLVRGITRIRVVESNAAARFNTADQTTNEAFYWPSIPAATVSAAEALSKRIADSGGLADFQAKLPAAARGVGRVVIHHTSAFTSNAFRSAATYDVELIGGSFGVGATVSFDAQGLPVASDW